MQLPGQVKITEVCPRDGFQNVKDFIETQNKIAIIKKLIDAGFQSIEITSFVSPKWIPQLADAKEVVAAIKEYRGGRNVELIALIPNQRGFDGAIETGVDAVSYVVSVSEAHNKNNVNKSVDQSLDQFEEMVKNNPDTGINVRLALATVFGCPFGEEIKTEKVLYMIERGLKVGIKDFLLADSIGMGNPKLVDAVLNEVLKVLKPEQICMHLHDTGGLALANTLAAMQNGITRFETATGGLGGCPYAPGASGNAATEDLVFMLDSMGVQTGIDTDTLCEALDMIHQYVNSPINSHLDARRKKD